MQEVPLSSPSILSTRYPCRLLGYYPTFSALCSEDNVMDHGGSTVWTLPLPTLFC
jgi:hypothetical protein